MWLKEKRGGNTRELSECGGEVNKDKETRGKCGGRKKKQMSGAERDSPACLLLF